MDRKRIILPVCFLIIICFIMAVVSVLKADYANKPKLNVLMLHMVTEKMPDDKSLSTLYITDEMLREYCEYFCGRYTVVSLEEAYDIVKNGKKTQNSDLIAFTFDDGYDNNYFLAYPILREFNAKANINVIARYTDENYPGYLTWNQIKEMVDSGLITIGSHTYDSHYYTDDAAGEFKPILASLLPGETKEDQKKRILNDLKLADELISANIGKDIDIIAYPYGVPPFDLMDEIKTQFGYDIQMLVRTGVNSEADMFNKLQRFTVDGSKNPEVLDREIRRYNGLNFLKIIKNN